MGLQFITPPIRPAGGLFPSLWLKITLSWILTARRGVVAIHDHVRCDSSGAWYIGPVRGPYGLFSGDSFLPVIMKQPWREGAFWFTAVRLGRGHPGTGQAGRPVTARPR